MSDYSLSQNYVGTGFLVLLTLIPPLMTFFLSRTKRKNLVVNWHFLRTCNYSCKFCFHTAKTSHVVSFDDAKKGLRKLHQEGMSRINLSGGEPFLKEKFLGQVCEFCHSELKIQVSIVSNGSNIRKSWFEKYGKFLDVLAISCDSFIETSLKEIGRFEKKSDHLKQLKQISLWCKDYDVKFKINTVVCTVNKNETMVDEISELNPCRWKVFQCLLIKGENVGDDAIRDAKDMVVTTNEFNQFVQRHQAITCIVPESNVNMRNSYLILDEYMCFLNNTNGDKCQTVSILDHDTKVALDESGFDANTFKKRGGEWCTTEIEW